MLWKKQVNNDDDNNSSDTDRRALLKITLSTSAGVRGQAVTLARGFSWAAGPCL